LVTTVRISLASFFIYVIQFNSGGKEVVVRKKDITPHFGSDL
jgi:hypothetical protein